MKINKEIISITLAYFLVALYVIIDNNPIITIVLITMLFVYHLVVYSQIRQKLSQDKETSVIKLQSKLEKTKRQREEEYKKFISLSRNLGSGLMVLDEEGIIKLANKDVNDFFSRNFNNTDYQNHSDIKSLHKFLNQAYLLEIKLRDQMIYKDHYYDLMSTPLFENKLFKGSLILVHDITLIKTAEKYQKQFTADVSHELRTPLSAIKGFSEILSRDKEIAVEEREEFIELIRSESERMETILNDLMIISKMDRLDYELNFNQLDIKDLVYECIGVLKNSILEKGLSYNVDVKSQILMLDKIKMSQVILNIVKNAMNYTDEGNIDIKGVIAGNQYILTITDTGIGIKESNYDKIFKRFYRVDKARSRDSGGSGLGLSISKNVVIKHNGNISVSSKVDEGTTFNIRLPIEK